MIISSSLCADDFIINVVESTVTDKRRQTLETYFDKIYQPVGIKPKFHYLPSHRGLEFVNTGIFDAEAVRFESVASQYPNLVKVKAPVAVVRSALFCLSSYQCEFVENAAIGVQQGFEGARQFCSQTKADCLFDASPKILARLLDSGVLSGLLLTEDEASQVICKLKSNDVSYQVLTQFERATFHWVHKKYASLVPALSDSIKNVNATAWFEMELSNWRGAIAQCGKKLNEI